MIAIHLLTCSMQYTLRISRFVKKQNMPTSDLSKMKIFTKLNFDDKMTINFKSSAERNFLNLRTMSMITQRYSVFDAVSFMDVNLSTLEQEDQEEEEHEFG